MLKTWHFSPLTFFLITTVGTITVAAPKAEYPLRVDLSKSLRPVTHCASGSLYGVTESLPADIDNLLAPLNPHLFTQPARAGQGFQQPIGAAIPVSKRITSTTGQVIIRLADICPGWPYQWPGQTKWLSEVTSVINEKISSGRSNYNGYEIWNEPDGTWQTANGAFTTTCWKPAFDLIRSKDPDASFIGPSSAYYNHTRMNDFLVFCKSNNCIPDVICWHELGGSAGISRNIADYRALEKSLGIDSLGISINEYCHTTHDYEGCPGTSAPFIAKFERNLVESACISWWFTNLPGRLGSLLTSSNQKGGGWWFYKWYGDMSGDMVAVTPPNDASDGIDGFACLDTVVKHADICLGGNNTGTVKVQISGIPALFGENVIAKVECLEWKNKDTPVSGPSTVTEETYTVSDGSITVPVNVTSQFYGYRVYLTPKTGIVATNNIRNSAPLNGMAFHIHQSNRLLTVVLSDVSINNTTFILYSPNGIELKKGMISGRNGNITVGDCASGVYVMKVTINKQSFVQKFIMK